MHDDLMQTASLEMWRLWQRYDPQRGSFFNLMATFIPGKLRDYVRKHEQVVRTPVSRWFKRDYATIIHLDADPDLTSLHPVTHDTAADSAATEEQAEILHAAVGELKAPLRAVVEGLFFRNVSAKDLAVELGVTHQAIYCRLKLAMASLRHSRLAKRCLC